MNESKSSFSAVILAAGYGTRLDRDVREDASGAHTSLIGLSKALVPVGGTTVLGHWLRQLAECDVDRVAIVTNHVHVNQFTQEIVPAHVRVVDDLSTSNADRLGAVADLQLALDSSFRSDSNQSSSNSDFVVIAGDTLFHRGSFTNKKKKKIESNRYSIYSFTFFYYYFLFQIFICVTF
jgi:choline kinase